MASLKGPSGASPKFNGPANSKLGGPGVPVVQKDAAKMKQAEGLKPPATCSVVPGMKSPKK